MNNGGAKSREKSTEEKIRETIARWRMLPEGCTVVAGLSGGADSMALVRFLKGYAREHGIRLIAAHVNHGLRGTEADSDEAFVSHWCGANGVELRVLHADVRKMAKKNSQGLEECGRDVRYSFFRELCGKDGRIATAHTLSDSVETVLMNLAKGAGTKGLCGIPPVRENIIRPLIGITRAEVEDYCARHGLSYVTDSSNSSNEFARNRIRHIVVPALKSVNPRLETAVHRTTELLRCDEEYFACEAGKLMDAADDGKGFCLSTLQKAPRAVLLHAIPRLISRVGTPRLEREHVLAVEQVVRAGKGAVTVAGGIQCFADGNTLFIARRNRKKPLRWEIPVSLPVTELPDGRALCVKPVSGFPSKFPHKINNLLFNNLINYDTILNTNSSCVRNRRDGDSFRPAGRGLTKTLKKLFNEAGVPPEKRDCLLILQSGGTILWIEGFGPSEAACVTADTHTAAEIFIRSAKVKCGK